MKNKLISAALSLAFSGAIALPAWAEDPHWTYDEQDVWGGIEDTSGKYTPPYPYAECGLGAKQSPVNLAQQADLSDVPLVTDQNSLKFQYDMVPFSVENNGHTLKISIPKGEPGEVIIGKDHYSLLQYHFHAPSEHQIAGQTYPMEVHFVHGTQDGKMAVVGVFFKQGRANPHFQTILNSASGQPTILEFNPASLLPKSRKAFFTYAGSLTTPPCSEGINWYVLKNPIEVSAKQIEAFKAFYDGNARNPQNANGRQVIRK